MDGVLLLNASYEPLAVLSLHRATKLLLRERVEPVADGVATEAVIHINSAERTFAIPTVLRLKVYVNVPQRNAPSWTRRGVAARDRNLCAYCGKKCGSSDLTVDHVIPLAKGGRSTWGNTVVACFRCNQRKADRMPHEAGMKLRIEPKTPRTRYVVARGDVPAAWKVWIEV
jgi:5-methylcytosine-specific restriction endonuclease McrA